MIKRKTVSLVSLLFSAIFCLFAFACQPSNGRAETVATASFAEAEKLCVIYCEETNGTDKLADVMQALKAADELQFEIVGGMVLSIGGVENAADYSACWMLYTTDAELSNTEWGTVEYGGKTLGSAIVGAESLPVKAGEYYVWSYQSF